MLIDRGLSVGRRSRCGRVEDHDQAYDLSVPDRLVIGYVDYVVAADLGAGLDELQLDSLVTGEALALPLVAIAGSKQIGDEVFNEIFHPIARRLIERVDAVLRIGGPSAGADEMVTLARAAGKQVFNSIDQIEPVNG